MTSDDQHERPFVLIVDDEPDDQEGYAASMQAYAVEAQALHPLDVTEEDLHRADIVTVDEYLDWEAAAGWSDINLPTLPALRPLDGLALAAVLQSHTESARRLPRTGFAIRTGQLDRLGEGLPLAVREPLLAAQHNLDWVFPKEQPEGEPINERRLASLALACRSMSADWLGSRDNLSPRWLQLDGTVRWHARALLQVEECRPPEHALAAYTRGSAYLRWFLQRILPFPTFLLSNLRASVRLGIVLADFESIIGSGTALDEKLNTCRYRGALQDFTSTRWWRAGLDDLIEEQLSYNPYEPAALAEALSNLHGEPLQPLPQKEPVVPIDAAYHDLPVPIEFNDAVRLSPDFWPVYADEPWSHKDEVASNDALRSLVVRTERSRQLLEEQPR
jgi:hypothetical protein